MKSVYGILKPIYKRMVPKCIQRLTWDRKYPFYRWIEPIKGRMQKKASHDEIYDAYYFKETVEGPMLLSADVMAKTIYEQFHPSSAIDVGCGPGLLLASLRKHGVEVRGYEFADAAIQIARAKGLQVIRYDLEKDDKEVGWADVAVSTEVAEHLPESCADRFVDLLTSAAPVVLMTAATPGQGGTDHVNEQPNAYWIHKFEMKGLAFDETMTALLKQQWSENGVEDFYRNNLMIFRKRSGQ